MADNGKLRFGLVGGGEGAFIGQVHRMAAELDGQAQLVCGAFASDPQRALRSGQQIYHLPPQRCYATYSEMFSAELALAPEQRMQFVIIAVPNHLHYPVAEAALLAGFDVVCDKPLTMDLQQALQLQQLQARQQRAFAVTFNYSGYPMIRQARDLVASGALGKLRRVSCSYLQGWLATDQPQNKQAQWRTDPQRAGAAGCFGDIGSHAENLLSYVSGLSVQRLCADLSSFVPGRALDDDGNVLLQMQGGARGVISASQIATGVENDLSLQIYGESGSLQWHQAQANSLTVRWLDQPAQLFRTAGAGLAPAAQQASRLPAGHPEGYLEAFAEIYRCFFAELRGQASGGYPTLADGVRGMRFIEKVVASASAGATWVEMADA